MGRVRGAGICIAVVRQAHHWVGEPSHDRLSLRALGLVPRVEGRPCLRAVVPPCPRSHSCRTTAPTRAASCIIDVPDFTDGKLVLSGLALTANTAAMDLTLRPPPNTKAARKAVKCNPPSCIVPLSDEAPSAEDALGTLPGPVIARRIFQRDEVLLLYAEVYDNRGGAARRVIVEVTLEDESHAQRTLLSETRESGGGGKRPTTHGLSARAVLSDVPPGSYLLRVEARSEAGGKPDATRAIPIEVR